MFIVGYVLGKIAEGMDKIFNLIPKFTVDFSMLNTAINTLVPYFNTVNTIFPLKETFVVLMILVTFSIAMFVFWGVQRCINLLRGAG